MATPRIARARPLLTRPGARFTCAGDGVCCHDVHLLGPVTRAEVQPLVAVRADVIDRRLGLPLVRTDALGRCVMLSDHERCTVHPTSSQPLAPRSCRRFPYLLVATPDGGRIGTDHRCPCRTMGQRAPVTAQGAEESLLDAAGRLSVDRRVGGTVPIAPRVRVSWARWRAIESELLSALEVGRPEDALGCAPFPPLDSMSWPQVAHDIAEDVPDTRWGWALRWFAAHLEAARTRTPGDVLPRPWRSAFDRAQVRTPVAGDPDAMLRDYVADAIWSMEWAVRGTLLHARLELRTSVEVARSVARALESRGTRADRAMAEALLVAEVGAVSEAWTTVVRRFVVTRAGPRPGARVRAVRSPGPPR